MFVNERICVPVCACVPLLMNAVDWVCIGLNSWGELHLAKFVYLCVNGCVFFECEELEIMNSLSCFCIFESSLEVTQWVVTRPYASLFKMLLCIYACVCIFAFICIRVCVCVSLYVCIWTWSHRRGRIMRAHWRQTVIKSPGGLRWVSDPPVILLSSPSQQTNRRTGGKEILITNKAGKMFGCYTLEEI